MSNAAPTVPHAVPHTNIWVQDISMTQANGSKRVGTIKIKDDRNRLSLHKWDATYELRDLSWTITADGALMPNSVEHVANNINFPFVMNSLGNDGIKDFLRKWLDYHGKGHVEERLEEEGEITASKLTSSNVVSKPPPLPPPVQPPVPKPEESESQPVVPKPQPKPEVQEPKPEPAAQVPVPQPKKDRQNMKKIKDSELSLLIEAIARELQIEVADITDTSTRTGSEARKIFCNLGTNLCNKDVALVAKSCGLSHKSQVYQLRKFEDPDLNTAMLKIKAKLMSDYPNIGQPQDEQSGPKRKYKKRNGKATEQALPPTHATAKAVVDHASLNGEFELIVYVSWEMSGRDVDKVAKSFGVKVDEVHRCAGVVVHRLGDRFVEVSTALQKCGKP